MQMTPHELPIWITLDPTRKRTQSKRTSRGRPGVPGVRLRRIGGNYQMLDGGGRPIGTIPNPLRTPRLGRAERTVFLWRDN